MKSFLRMTQLLPRQLMLPMFLLLLPAVSPAAVPHTTARSAAPAVGEFSSPFLRVQPSLELYADGSAAKLERPELASFFAKHTDRWQIRWDIRSDRPHLLQGIGIPLLPGRGNDLGGNDLGGNDLGGNDLEVKELGLEPPGELTVAEVESRVWAFLAESPQLLRVSELDLRLDRQRSQSFGAEKHLWFIELQQYHQGVPVEGARVFFRINHGNIVQLGTTLLAEVAVTGEPRIDRQQAVASAMTTLGVAQLEKEFIDAGQLKIYPAMTADEQVGHLYTGARGRGYEHHLVWEVVYRLAADAHVYKVLVDAQDGAVLEYSDLTRYESARVSGQIYPLTSLDPLLEVGLPFASVDNDGETIVTDGDGVYDYSGGTATVTLNGRYARIIDRCGQISLSDDSTGNLDFGGAPGTDCATPGVGGPGNTNAARTTFYNLTRMHRKAAEFYPENPWLDGTLPANVNLPNNDCGAFWNGIVNFARDGELCNNTGEIAGAVIHEWGHGFDENTGGQTSDAGTGEALGDTFALLELREPCIAENFFTEAPCPLFCSEDCSGLRDIAEYAIGGGRTIARPDTVEDDAGLNCDNELACPFRDGFFPYQGPMGYEGHCESQIATTANWDLAQMLVAEYGEDEGWATLENIWWASVPPSDSAYRLVDGGLCNPQAVVDGCDATNWYPVYLAVDDDDGNLDNGTPNGCRIWDAFDAHGIACGERPECTSGGGDSQMIFASIASHDGWIQESAAGSGVGAFRSSADSSDCALRGGDNLKDRQYRNIVSFDTSDLPDGATIVSATLRLRRGTVSGSDPFDTHETLWIDIHQGSFGAAAALESIDFSAPATAERVSALSRAAADGDWSEAELDAAGLVAINRDGLTQLRVYFERGSNGDRGNDYVGYYSAESAAENHPQLVVIYQP